MKKTLLMAAMLVGLFTTTAGAAERMKVNDIHNFVSRLNAAVNSFNASNGRSELEHLISNQAVFEDNVNQHRYYNNRRYVDYGYDYGYGYGYRYPYYDHSAYSNVGFTSNNKWEKISALRTKKRTVPGYRGTFTISNTRISPIGDSSTVDVEFKEKSTVYTPHSYRSRYSEHAALNTHSKCKMDLAKVNNTVYLTRLYCNTSTNLPF